MNLDPIRTRQPRRRSLPAVRHILPLAVLVLPLAGCVTWGSSNTITGSGRIVTREFDLTGFTQVAAGSAFHVTLSQGAPCHAAVTIDDNLADYLDVSQTGDKLHVFLKPNLNIQRATLKATVIMPEVTGLDLSGATATSVAGFTSEKPLRIALSGASHLRGDIQSGDAKFGVSGAANVELRGGAQRLQIKASGASHVNLRHYPSKDTVVEADGASHVTVNPRGRLEVNASGASSIRYVGRPESTQSHTSGASSVRPK